MAATRTGPLAGLRRMEPRRTTRDLVRAFADHDLLTYASAIAFQVFFALIPLLLTGLGILGLFSLQDVWGTELAPKLRPQVSPPVFEVIDSTVRRVLASKELFWATLGAGLAIWEISGAMRAVMTVLGRIYRVRRERGWVERYAVSIALSALMLVLTLAAGAVLALGRAYDGPAGWLRWPVAGLPLLAALAAVVRWAPAEKRDWQWVSFGTALVVVAWLAMSAGFALYLQHVADYASIFGNLATIIVALEYLYLSAIVFLGGLALDGLAQRRP
jgi:membrane protein